MGGVGLRMDEEKGVKWWVERWKEEGWVGEVTKR